MYAIVASLGGAPKNPVWYHNVKADPDVELQDGTETGRYTAREVTGEEKARLVGAGRGRLPGLRRLPAAGPTGRSRSSCWSRAPPDGVQVSSVGTATTSTMAPLRSTVTGSGTPDRVAEQLPLDALGVLHRAPADVEHQVTGAQPGPRRRAAGDHLGQPQPVRRPCRSATAAGTGAGVPTTPR